MGKRPNPGQFRIGFVLFALALTALTASGCARQDSNADEQRRGSLYGGVTGGWSATVDVQYYVRKSELGLQGDRACLREWEGRWIGRIFPARQHAGNRQAG